MADDPLRQQVVKFLDAQYPHATLADHQFGADSLLSIFAKADPLRALLADPVRFHELVRNAGESVGATVGFNMPAARAGRSPGGGRAVSYDATESLQIALREYLAEVGSSNESRACVLAEELERELGQEVANGG